MTLWELLAVNAGVIGCTMFCLWLLSLRLKDASIVDLFWGFGFVMIAWTTYFFVGHSTRGLVVALLTTLWGLRLSAYLAWRNHGRGEDPRYVAMREYRGETFWWFSLISVFGFQGAVMCLISLPVQAGQLNEASLGLAAFVGIIVWAIGFFFESVGDYQLAKFKSRPENSGKVMDRGLWQFTRHPNYFGNALIWWGLFMVSASWSTLWLAISPLLMTFFLVKVSGVAMLEKTLAARSAEYRDYVKRTSVFIPWLPKRTSAIKADV